MIYNSTFDSEEMSEGIANNLEEHVKMKSADTGRQPTIFLFVEHGCSDMSHSLYVIKPPVDMPKDGHLIDSEGFMADSENISPVATFKEEKHFLPHSASVNLGSKIYFFGGRTDSLRRLTFDYKRLTYEVKVFDIDHPEREFQYTAPMNGPKETPCVFVANDMIYALGSVVQNPPQIRPGFKGTGLFERYDPSFDRWEVLPDPPPLIARWMGGNFVDCATVVGRRVFIGSSIRAIFNLDSHTWDPFPPSELNVRHFPYGSLYVKVTDSLYHLSGPGIWKAGTKCIDRANYREPVKVVKRGTLTTTKDISLLNEQIMTQGADLDENMPFTNFGYSPWRELFHMGGRFFCYVVTAQLLNCNGPAQGDRYSRGVLIKFFEEVPAYTDENNSYTKSKFRPLASFCYKISTKFPNSSLFIRCSILGSVPDSWINAPPLKKKQETKLKHLNKERDQILVTKTVRPEYKAENNDDLMKLLAVREEENRSLATELARKNELLKTYEALLAKAGVVVDL